MASDRGCVRSTSRSVCEPLQGASQVRGLAEFERASCGAASESSSRRCHGDGSGYDLVCGRYSDQFLELPRIQLGGAEQLILHTSLSSEPQLEDGTIYPR